MQHRYRLLFLFLLGLWLNTSTAQAQYQIGDYLVRAVPANFQDISGGGTDITGDIVGSIYDASWRISKSEYTIPFNFRWINTVSNKIKVTGLGGVIIGGNATVSEGRYYTNNYYYADVNYRQIEYSWDQTGVYYPNNSIHAWRGYMYGHTNYKIHIGVRGTAPNREFVVQATNLTPAFTPGTPVASTQVVLFESGISKLEFHYRADVAGNWRIYPYSYYPYYGPFIDLTGWEPVDDQGYYYSRAGGASGSRMDIRHVNGIQPGQAPTVNLSTWGGYPWSYDQPVPGASVPEVGYRVFIAYPYDLAALSITNPQLEQILNKDVTFTPQGTITNEGSSAPASAVINRRITLAGVGQVYSQNINITPPSPFQSATYSFPDFTPVSYGIYYDTMEVISTNPADQYAANNMTSTTYVVSPPNNIRAISILSPAPSSRTPINIATPIGARFRNLGANAQTNVPVSVVIRNPANQVVYRDTVRIPQLASGEYKDTTFRDWTPTQHGTYRFCAIAIMATDQLRTDDTSCSTALVAYETDVAAVSVVAPAPLEEKPEKKTFQVFGRFRSVGVSDLFDIPMRLVIKRCSDNAIVFLADTTMGELNVDQGNVSFGFPTQQGSYDVRNILPGCYTACVIARYSTDGDRANDTACTNFSIIPQLKGDIEVGFGRRFPTISAAVDSMRFRGVGGHLNLWLTDEYYVENGNTSVSTPSAAIDFRGIIGTGENAVVTWKPVRGVSPRIAFYGSKAHSLYFGAGSPSYMIWDGMNQFNPTPELRVQDPSKRGITIVDSSTAAGATIAIEHGFSNNMTFKNLNVIGRGMMTNDSSAVFRLFNERSLATFTVNRITDTMPNHHIVIENNAIGNARYGIWDRGLPPLFSVGPAQFFDRRNYSNVFTRNTIGSAQQPLGRAGIAFDNEQDLLISMNEISNVNTSLAGGGMSGAGVMQLGEGNVARVQVTGNKIHNITGSTQTLGVQFAQNSTVYTQGTGANQARSVLPTSTANRVTNNMIWDLRGSGVVVPVTFSTMATNYWTSGDSVYHNTITTNNAMYDLYMAQVRYPFVMNNIFQNTSTGTSGAHYYFEVPRPFTSRIKSDYNVFDLTGTRPFAVVVERDSATGNTIQTRTFRRLNDWRTFTEQDVHSIVGDPMFQGSEPRLPGALSYIPTPASNNGIWLGTQLQARDIDGDLRQMGNLTPDIGADEVEGFELTNDLGVMAIYKPAGYSSTSDTTFYVAENPLHIQALVKNLSNNALYNRTVTATLEVALNGGAWNTIWTGSKSGLTFDLNESKIVDFQGPVITPQQEQQGVFRVTISTANDQNNLNNQQTKSFRLMIKRQAILVSYDGSHARGIQNKDSVTRALIRLGVRYDSINRANFSSIDIDYTPWWTVVYTVGDATAPATGSLSFKQTEELTRYLNAGRTYAKKSLVLSGQNIAFYNDFGTINGNGVTDREFMRGMLRTRYVANAPVSGTYMDTIDGRQVYFQFKEFLNSTSPDVVWKTVNTPPVGEEVSGIAYTYRGHTATPADSGAGTTWAGKTFNTVFFAFDMADVRQSKPGESRILTSGATRVMRGALDFIQSARGVYLPVNFVNVDVRATETGNEITWKTGDQKDVARFEVESLVNNEWSKAGEVSAKTYTFTDNVTENGTYSYRVVAVDLDGSRTTSQVKSVTRTSDRGFALLQNYPNPMVSETEIGFTLAEPAMVTINVLDVTGKVVATVTSRNYGVGTWSESLNQVLPNGTYVYEMTALTASGETVKLQRKMTVTK